MPRLVDDKWRTIFLLCSGVAVAVAVAAATAWTAYMRPFRERREAIAAVLKEGRDFAARFDAEAQASQGGASAAGKALRPVAEMRTAEIEPLVVDPSFYTADDRKKAEAFAEEYKKAAAEMRRAISDADTAKKRASALQKRIAELEEPAGANAARTARLELQRSMAALEKLHDMPRPDEKRTRDARAAFDKAMAAATEARSKTIDREKARRQIDAEAKTVVEAVRGAQSRIREAAAKIASVREGVSNLKIEVEGSRLAELRKKVDAAAVAVDNAVKNADAASSSARAKWAKVSGEAAATCSSLAKKATALREKHGDLIPSAAVQPVAEAPAKVKAIADEAGKTLVSKQAALDSAKADAEAFRKGVARFRGALGDVPSKGGNADLASFAALPENAAAVEKKIADAAAGFSALDDCVRRVENAVAAAEKASGAIVEPDIQALVGKIRNAAEGLGSNLAQQKPRLESLRTKVVDGSGPAKNDLLKFADECTAAIANAETLVGSLKSASAANGKEVVALTKRQKEAEEAVKRAADSVAAFENRRIADATKFGAFTPLVWEAGVVGRSPKGGAAAAGWQTVAAGDRLVAPPGIATDAYQWEFAIDVPDDGTHKIEIVLHIAGDKRIPNLNTAMPDKRLGKAKGGFVDVACRLESGNLKWADGVSGIPNKDRARKSEATALSATGKFGKGRREFDFRIDLSINGDSKAKLDTAAFQKIPGGWNPSGVEFFVYFDGKPVREFWHRKR
ncbi:MAG: hypothetical protein IJ783_04675 [Kiritimatiellae bacterium]|nr:hypothetical protein [Kiritimatiellia bacterium]